MPELHSTLSPLKLNDQNLIEPDRVRPGAIERVSEYRLQAEPLQARLKTVLRTETLLAHGSYALPSPIPDRAVHAE